LQVRELEEEIRGERPRRGGSSGQQQQQGGDEGEEEAEEVEEEEEDGDFEIDSGDEAESSEDEGEGEGAASSSSDEEEDEEDEEAGQQGAAPAGDPLDAELAGGPAGASSDEEDEAAAEEDGERLAGGAADVDADDDAGVCASLFKVGGWADGRVGRKQALLAVLQFRPAGTNTAEACPPSLGPSLALRRAWGTIRHFKSY